jgi:hypothetical protein
MHKHTLGATIARGLFTSWCATPMSRVPGMDTAIRLAWRIECGCGIEEAASAEYVYHWHLAVKPFDQCEGRIRNPCCSIFGTPHTIGM